MEVIEDGNIMDRIPILLQRDLEYYQKNQTVLSETICHGVVGGRLDFPRNASFAAVKIVLWLEDEFSIAFKQGSGMFVTLLEDDQGEGGVAKTSDPDKFVQLAIKSSDLLLEHLHMLAQEALDHADLPVLTATLGAAALLKNSLHCYVQHLEDMGNAERHSLLQACYKRYVTMSEAVGERVLDLHNRVLSLYILQDSGGRPIDDQSHKVPESGSPSVQGWWLYMQGSRKDLWDTVPPRMAQRIFAGMLNETLTILNVRYCQANTTDRTTPLLINDILNILLCVAQLLPAICNTGSDLTGLEVKLQSRDVRDVHAKCNELFKCMVYRGAALHFIHQTFKEHEETPKVHLKEHPSPWFTFVSPNLFDNFDDVTLTNTQELPIKTALGLELLVLLAQPQPSWPLLVKVLMMRNCHLARSLLIHSVRHMCAENGKWPSSGLWYSAHGRQGRCGGFLCTADGFCKFQGDNTPGEEYAKASGALTHILATIGSKTELKSTLAYALEISGRDWAACLDKRQVWCDRRPPWLAGILGIVDSALRFIPPILVNALRSGASMYQTMSLCLTCISRSLDCIPRTFANAAEVIQKCLPSHINPVGGSVLLQMLITVAYEELQVWAQKETQKEKHVSSESNGEPHMNVKATRPKQVRIMSMGHTMASSVSFDGSHSSPASIALAIAEALCSIDEDDKHTQEIEQLVTLSDHMFKSSKLVLEDFPEFALFFEEGNVPGSNAERVSDAAALTSQILMTRPGQDSLRVIYDHLQLHAERIYKELGIQEVEDCLDAGIPIHRAPLIYIMFHIGRRPFDQYLRGEWPMPWSRLAATAKSLSGIEGAKVHVTRRSDMRSLKNLTKCTDNTLLELCEMFKSCNLGVWCDRRPPWLAGILGIVDSALRFIPPILVNALRSGASMYQTMSLCLTCISRSLDCIPRTFANAAEVIQKCLPSHINPVGGSVLLQMLITVAYEELQVWAQKETQKEKHVSSESNGEPHMNVKATRPKQVRIMSMGHTMASSVSFDGSHSSPASIALAIAEALCSIDEDDKHTQEIEQLVTLSDHMFKSSKLVLEDFPEFALFFEEGNVPGSNAERVSDAAALTSQILMTRPGQDSLRVIYDHLQLHAERIYKELGIQEVEDCLDAGIPIHRAPLIYIMFHIGRRPFDQYLRGEWPMPWSRLAATAKSLSGIEGAKVHVTRRSDMRSLKNLTKCTDNTLLELCEMFKSCNLGVL